MLCNKDEEWVMFSTSLPNFTKFSMCDELMMKSPEQFFFPKYWNFLFIFLALFSLYFRDAEERQFWLFSFIMLVETHYNRFFRSTSCDDGTASFSKCLINIKQLQLVFFNFLNIGCIFIFVSFVVYQKCTILPQIKPLQLLSVDKVDGILGVFKNSCCLILFTSSTNCHYFSTQGIFFF